MNKRLALRIAPLLPLAWLAALRAGFKTQKEAYALCRRYCTRCLRIAGLKVQVQGLENIPKESGCLFICNHQGTLDPVFLMHALPVPVAFISKQENAKLPMLGRWARAIGTIHFDRTTREGSIHMVREAVRRLKDGENLLLFPEGTRSRQDAMNPFQTNAFQIPRLARCTVVPVSLSGAYALDVCRKPDCLQVRFGKPVPYEAYKSLSTAAFAKEMQNRVESRVRKSGRLPASSAPERPVKRSLQQE